MVAGMHEANRVIGGQMRRGLITGGAGFIGSHIARGMLEREWDVIVLDGRAMKCLAFARARSGDPRSADAA